MALGKSTDGGVGKKVVAIVREGDISDTEPVEHSQHACTICDLVQAFNADETRDAT